ncbi:hypothetical protein TraAM80_10585 [Trypanosoma rangeli]|uniref:Transmembrane protein n=1 Tax=Trypanosoma rangeli TaxID=5698 RepID=A0A422MNL3_TRYRA|nr:uncharacterized protein TraAM80_10585 [Trypanosoma rangeli]RNE94798.1 hypothetical protein TraAM80_10585 [Trypanosoma rangeli]|eukprot:RNE94798.1 hypothetical protein TraAM80_10585 [Trypanosoma rangeli]
MPRLPVWFGGTALFSGGYYTFYHCFYTPRHTTWRELESAIEAEKLRLQYVLQRYAVLGYMLQRLRQSGAEATNRERLYIYCEMQQLREAFYNFPMRSQSASEKQKVMQDLDAVEVTYCTAPNFRDEALTLRQMITCQFCFGLYAFCFCLLDSRPAAGAVQSGGADAETWTAHRVTVDFVLSAYSCHHDAGEHVTSPG